MTRFGGIAAIVIPAKAGIQGQRARRSPSLDSRFRGNDTGKRVIGSVLMQHALALTQTEGAGIWASLSKIALAEAVQSKGLDALL